MSYQRDRAKVLIGHPKHLESLSKNDSARIRQHIAAFSDYANKDKFVTDKDPKVRRALAYGGTDEHRDKLLKDKDAGVREWVARSGNRDHLKKL
jgi:hypothetical protein